MHTCCCDDYMSKTRFRYSWESNTFVHVSTGINIDMSSPWFTLLKDGRPAGDYAVYFLLTKPLGYAYIDRSPLPYDGSSFNLFGKLF